MKRLIGMFLLLLAVLATRADGPRQFRIHHFYDTEGFSQTHVIDVIQDSEGFIWLAAMDGLWQYDGRSFRNFKTTPGDNCPLETNRIVRIVEDKDHNIVCKSSGKFYVFDRHTHRFSKCAPQVLKRGYPSSDKEKAEVAALPDYAGMEFRVLCHDRQQGLWVMSHRGLERLEPMDAPIEPHKTSAEWKEEFIRAIYTDRSRRLWLADKNGRVRVKGQDGQMRYLSAGGQLTDAPVVFGPKVYCIYEDSRHDIWLGTKPDGLYRLQPAGNGYTVQRYVASPHEKYGLNDNNIYGITEDRYGHLLVATYGGGLNVVERTADGLRFYHHANGLSYPLDAIESKGVALTADGHILLPTTRGLVVSHVQRDIRDMAFTIHHREPARAESLCNDIVNSVYVSRGGTVFLATTGGVDQIVSKNLSDIKLNFRHYSTSEGLPSDICLSLVEDLKGNLWVVSEVALGCLNPKQGVSLNYMRNFFSGRFVFSEVAPLCFPSGELVFGTTQGTLAFHPERIAKSTFVPRLTVDCDSVVNLYADAPNLDIRMAALDLNQHERIVYAYRLEGVDDDWHFTESNELHFAALSPGTYLLHLKSTNGDGVWVQNERVVRIVRHADFGETPYAWMLCAVALLLVAFLAYKLLRYIRQLHRTIRELKMSGNDQLSIVGDQLREIFVSHELPDEIADTSDALTPDERAFADHCQQFIRDNMANEELDVPTFAREMCMSRTKLYALVKKVYGTSPNSLIVNVRIREAQRLLSQQEGSVADVAYRCGFSDPHYFSRCFKRLVGVSPSEYGKANVQ